MTQTTDGLSMVDCSVEYSLNGSDWTDISGFAASAEPDGGERQTAEAYTFDGDVAVVRAGKRDPLELTYKIVYTEGTADPYAALLPYYEAGSQVYFRHSPKGGDSTEFMFTSDAGYITKMLPPGGEAEGGDVIMTEIAFKTPKYIKSTVS